MEAKDMVLVSEIDKELPLVPEADRDMLVKASEAFKGMQLGMSGFQIKHGVLRHDEFPTADSKYWQCVREIHARFGSLVDSQYNYNKVKIEVLKLELELKRTDATEMDEMTTKNELWHNSLTLKLIEINLEDTLRQIREFYVQMNENDKERTIVKDFVGEHKATKEESEQDFWKAKQLIQGISGSNGQKIGRS